jgi:selenide,water dikinase
LQPAEQTQAISALAMRCGGCGAKVGASVLSRALAQVQPIERDDVLIGLHAPDDAAVLRVPPGKALVHSVDFFRAFIDDPWIFGRIAANHALGDVFAMGAEAQSATAIATVPPGLESKVEDTLFQMMSGAVSVLNEAGCALVGGHTGEGRELALGFAVNGLIDEALAGVLTKGGLRPGDALILTKPIGTGTLLAAHAQLKARGRWIDAALDSMQVSNRAAVACLIAHGARACTDLTGFGLLGHLVEMTKPSGVDAELELDPRCPCWTARLETVAAGVLEFAATGQYSSASGAAQPGSSTGAPELPAAVRSADRRRSARRRAGSRRRGLPGATARAGLPARQTYRPGFAAERCGGADHTVVVTRLCHSREGGNPARNSPCTSSTISPIPC